MKYLILLLCLCGSGCNYSHCVVNVGNADLYAVNVADHTKVFGHGLVAAGSTARYYGSFKLSRTPSPGLSWKNKEDGVVLERSVPLERNPGSRWTVIFELDGTNVSARMKPR